MSAGRLVIINFRELKNRRINLPEKRRLIHHELYPFDEKFKMKKHNLERAPGTLARALRRPVFICLNQDNACGVLLAVAELLFPCSIIALWQSLLTVSL